MGDVIGPCGRGGNGVVERVGMAVVARVGAEAKRPEAEIVRAFVLGAPGGMGAVWRGTVPETGGALGFGTCGIGGAEPEVVGNATEGGREVGKAIDGGRCAGAAVLAC